MTSKRKVEAFLIELQVKINIFGLLFRDDRGKNQQTLHDLEITPTRRKEIIKSLKVTDYCQGPLEEILHDILPMWVFGKEIKGKEIYIKISMGVENSSAVCISFHIAEHKMTYPFRK